MQVHLPCPGNAFPYVKTAWVRSRMAQLWDPSASKVVQAHPLLPPPPLPGHQTVPSVCLLAFRKDAAVDHVLCVHHTLLQYFIWGWVDPLMRPPLRYVLPHHPIRRGEVESLKPCQSGRAQDSRLTSICWMMILLWLSSILTYFLFRDPYFLQIYPVAQTTTSRIVGTLEDS